MAANQPDFRDSPSEAAVSTRSEPRSFKVQQQQEADRMRGARHPLMPASFHFSFGDQFKEMTGALLEGVKRPLQNEIKEIRGMVWSLLGDHGLGEAQAAGHL